MANEKIFASPEAAEKFYQDYYKKLEKKMNKAYEAGDQKEMDYIEDERQRVLEAIKDSSDDDWFE